MVRVDRINTYNDLLNALKKCKGSIVQIIYDSDISNKDLINSFKNDLTEYKIIDFNELYVADDGENIFGRKARAIIKMINDKYILIVLKRYYTTMGNTWPILESDKLTYSASLILLLQNKKLKILKWRFGSENYNYIDINILLRKIKLKKLNQKNNI
jgi:ABC-type branched-subunit amino acid transport system substrate-binding protein